MITFGCIRYIMKKSGSPEKSRLPLSKYMQHEMQHKEKRCRVHRHLRIARGGFEPSTLRV